MNLESRDIKMSEDPIIASTSTMELSPINNKERHASFASSKSERSERVAITESPEEPVIGYIRNHLNDKFCEVFDANPDGMLKKRHKFCFKPEFFPCGGWAEFQNAKLLHIAVFYNNPFVVRYLLRNEATDINVTTTEHLTPLHLACRLGHVLITDILLQKDPSATVEDSLGRTPLHYAVISEKFAIVLLLNNKYPGLDFTKSDSLRKTPVEYAEQGHLVNLLNELTGGNVHSLWEPKKLQMYCCTNPIKGRTRKGLVFCRCGQQMDLHDKNFMNLSQDRDWSKSRDMRKMPTNAFGEIEFSGISQTAKFARMAYDTEEDTIHDLFQNNWCLPQPAMVICIYGNECFSITIKDEVRKAIWKSVGQSNAWIISNGVNMDVVRMIGEAVRDYCDAYGNDAITSIGVVPWNSLMHRDILMSEDYEGSFPTIYPVQKASFEEVTLNSNCTHFMMADTSTRNYFGAESEFRSLVERCAVSWKVVSDDKTVSKHIPICGILIAGDRTTLKEVYNSIVKNGCPLVVLKGTGGLSDILSELIEESTKSSVYLTEEAIQNAMISNWLLSADDAPEPDEIKQIKQIVRQSHMIEMFQIDQSHDLDGRILSALLSSASKGAEVSTKVNIGQLEIALTLNRADVAKSKVFSDQKTWNAGELDETFITALIDTKVGFVKLFIEQGFRLEKFVTPKLLERLYNEDFKSSNEMPIFRNILNKMKHQSSKWITLIKIGRVVANLIPSFYKPLYLSDDFLAKYSSSPYDPVDRPPRELFLWSLLTQRIEMAEFIWTLQRDAMASGLFAAILLRQMAAASVDVIVQEELVASADKFEERSTGVFDECYNEDDFKAMESLTRKLKYFGNSTCLILAAEGESIKFIAHRGCLELLKNIWFGALDKTAPFIKFFFAILFGIIPTPIVTLLMDFETESKYRRIDVSKVPETRCSNCCYSVWNKMGLFYTCPLVKFLYSTCTYFIFLLLFSYTLLFQMDGFVHTTHIICFVMFLGLLVEEIFQAFRVGTSFSSYASDLWNKLDLCAILLFVTGSLLYCSSYYQKPFNDIYIPVSPVDLFVSEQPTLLRVALILLGISLFIYYTRLLQVFSININLGPKVLMIFRMIVDDLIPFMIIYLIFVVAYGVLLYSVTFHRRHPTVAQMMEHIFDMLRTAYFESFGELRLDHLTQSASSCTAGSICPDYVGRWASLMFLGVYMLITNVLLLNMLIAMFSHTYENVQTMAIQYWTLQRYTIINEYTERSVPPPPFNIIWIILSIPVNIYRNCRSMGRSNDEGPFLQSYDTNRLYERQLIQWERLRVLDYLRSLEDTRLKSKKNGQAVYVNRTSILSGNSVNVKKELSEVRDELGDKFKESLHDVEVQLGRLDHIEEQLGNLQDAIADLARSLGSQQTLMIDKIQEQQKLREKEKKDKKLKNVLKLMTSRPQTSASKEESPVQKMAQPKRRKQRADDYDDDDDDDDRNFDAQDGPSDPPRYYDSPFPNDPDRDHSSSGHPSTVGRANEDSSVDFSSYPETRPPLDEEISMSIMTPTMEPEPFLWEFSGSSGNHVFSRLVPYNADTSSRAARVFTDWRKLTMEYEPNKIKSSLFHESKLSDPSSTKDFQFNVWDNKFNVNRKSLLKFYQIKDGLPLNPEGRQGVAKRGILPFWGPNHVVHILLTRWKRDEKDTIVRRDGKMVLQCVVVQIQRLYQLPWYFIHHQKNCDIKACVIESVKKFLEERAKELYETKKITKSNYEVISLAIKKLEPYAVYGGILDDYVNADNAWIETVAVNCHEVYSHNTDDIFLKIFDHGDSNEKLQWIDVYNRRLMRASHIQLCEAVANHHNAAF